MPKGSKLAVRLNKKSRPKSKDRIPDAVGELQKGQGIAFMVNSIGAKERAYFISLLLVE
jgi:hypothetical protein